MSELSCDKVLVHGMKQEHKSNLLRLAHYLLALPRDYEKFSMNRYCAYRLTKNCNEIRPWRARQLHAECKTIACAVGHGPMAGIGSDDPNLSWDDYVRKYFGLRTTDDAWCWCFSGSWSSIDNSPDGAARRILYMLKHGVPKDWSDQIFGRKSICY